MTSREKRSPSLMDQYKTLKRQHSDAVLLCRVGDFYEAFNALKAADYDLVDA